MSVENCPACGQPRYRFADCLHCGDAPLALVRKYGAARARVVWWGKTHPFTHRPSSLVSSVSLVPPGTGVTHDGEGR